MNQKLYTTIIIILKNTVVSKAATGFVNIFNSETVTVLNPQEELVVANVKINFKNCLKPEIPLYLVMSY